MPGNIDSALVSTIVYRESFYEFKRKFKRIKYPSNLFGVVETLNQLGKEDGMIMVESPTRRGRVDVGIGLITLR